VPSAPLWFVLVFCEPGMKFDAIALRFYVNLLTMILVILYTTYSIFVLP